MAKKEIVGGTYVKVFNPETGEGKRFPVAEIPGGWTRTDPNAKEEKAEKKEKPEKKEKKENGKKKGD